MITLKEAKTYLRVDYDEDDSLIQNLLSTSKNLGQHRIISTYKQNHPAKC